MLVLDPKVKFAVDVRRVKVWVDIFSPSKYTKDNKHEIEEKETVTVRFILQTYDGEEIYVKRYKGFDKETAEKFADHLYWNFASVIANNYRIFDLEEVYANFKQNDE